MRAQPSTKPNESEAAHSRAKKVDVNSTEFCRAVENLKAITKNVCSATVFTFLGKSCDCRYNNTRKKKEVRLIAFLCSRKGRKDFETYTVIPRYSSCILCYNGIKPTISGSLQTLLQDTEKKTTT